MRRYHKKKKVKKLKKKLCRACKEEFQPVNSLHITCKLKCAIDYTKIKHDRKYKILEKRNHKAHNKRKKEVKPLKHWVDYTQRVFNNFIVQRDIDEPCFTCRKYNRIAFHAGHMKTTKSRPDLRFNEDNCFKQCSYCNVHLSGNIQEYTSNLIKKIGQERFDALIPVNLHTYTVEELKLIRKKYNQKIKKLKNENT